MSSWIDKIKTLPNRNGPLAGALCRTFCLSLIYTPVFIMAWMGVELAGFWLFIPIPVAIALAIPLSFAWRKFALRLEDESAGAFEAYSSEYRGTVPDLIAPKTAALDFSKSQATFIADKDKSLFLEKKLNKLAAIATRFQWMGTAVIPTVALIKGIFGSYNYVATLWSFSAVALLFSFVLSRLYAHTRKQLEKAKQLTEEEQTGMYHEYRGKFLWPHIFWAIMFGVFSCL